RLKQNRPVTRSLRLVVHVSIGPPSVTPNFDFIVRLLGYGDLLARWAKSEMEASRTTERLTPGNGSLGTGLNQFVRRPSPLDSGPRNPPGFCSTIFLGCWRRREPP